MAKRPLGKHCGGHQFEFISTSAFERQTVSAGEYLKWVCVALGFPNRGKSFWHESYAVEKAAVLQAQKCANKWGKGQAPQHTLNQGDTGAPMYTHVHVCACGTVALLAYNQYALTVQCRYISVPALNCHSPRISLMCANDEAHSPQPTPGR